MAIKKYYEKDTNIKDIENETIGIIGYGIQGRNQALNLRDNGMNVLVSTRKDNTYDSIKTDGFKQYELKDLAKKSSIIMLLIPDQAQGEVFNQIKPFINKKSMLVTAHGYSLKFKEVLPKDDIDVILLAPRFPGAIVRKNFLDNKGTLAYFDVFQDFTNNARRRGLALANAIGFTKSGSPIIHVSIDEETEIDLFIEQFLIPTFLNTIQTGFEVLKNSGYSPEVSLMELYTSGEIVGLLNEGIEIGLYSAFQNNTSPTCQFGVAESFKKIINDETKSIAKNILKDIKNGNFTKRLNDEALKGYPNLKKFNRGNLENDLSITQKYLLKNIK